MSPVAALTAAPRSVGEAAFHGPIWVDARIVPGLVPPPTRSAPHAGSSTCTSTATTPAAVLEADAEVGVQLCLEPVVCLRQHLDPVVRARNELANVRVRELLRRCAGAEVTLRRQAVAFDFTHPAGDDSGRLRSDRGRPRSDGGRNRSREAGRHHVRRPTATRPRSVGFLTWACRGSVPVSQIGSGSLRMVLCRRSILPVVVGE